MGKRTTTASAALLLIALLACKEGDKPAPVASGGAAAPSPEPAAAPAQTKPDVTVSIKELLTAYGGNELAADAKFKGKRVAVVGQVKEVKKDILNDAYVIIGNAADLEIPQAQCYFQSDEQSTLATLEKGQLVGVSCKCDGLMVHVQLTDCTIVRHKDGGLFGKKAPAE